MNNEAPLDSAFDKPMYRWVCDTCGGVQGEDREQCHNCYEGRRPDDDELFPAEFWPYELDQVVWHEDIKVGHRFRKDFGDIDALAQSIDDIGLMQPIGVTQDNELVFGERRLKAMRTLGWPWIPRTVVDIDSIIDGEFAENEVRKDFTPSERVAIAAAIEESMANRRGQRTDLGHVAHVPHVAGEKTREVAAAKAGFGSSSTYRNAKKVTEDGADSLVEKMDSGEVSIRAAADVATLPPDEQDEIVAKGEKEILEAAKRIRKNHRAQGTGENEWYTPDEYLDSARAVMGGIDLDPASSEIANLKVQADKYYTIDDDGLSQKWAGRVWLNPPYSQPAIANFANAVASNATACESMIVLTHNYTDTKWFHHIAEVASAICFTRGRIGFLSPSGEKAAPTQGQAFFYIGSDLKAFSNEFTKHGLVVHL